LRQNTGLKLSPLGDRYRPRDHEKAIGRAFIQVQPVLLSGLTVIGLRSGWLHIEAEGFQGQYAWRLLAFSQYDSSLTKYAIALKNCRSRLITVLLEWTYPSCQYTRTCSAQRRASTTSPHYSAYELILHSVLTLDYIHSIHNHSRLT